MAITASIWHMAYKRTQRKYSNEKVHLFFLSWHTAFARHSQECNPDYSDHPLFWSRMPLEGEQKGHVFLFVEVHSLCNPWIGSVFF